MALFKTSAVVAFLITVVLLDVALVQARMCVPECGANERCVAANPRERRGGDSVCLPIRCLMRARRGRCHHHGNTHYTFNRATLSCELLHTGACYGRNNRFSSMELCEATCSPFYR